MFDCYIDFHSEAFYLIYHVHEYTISCGTKELCCCYGSTLLQGFGIFITVHTGLVFWCPTMSLTLRKCEEMHSRRCVTNNQAAECRFKGAALMFWALRVVFTGDACLTRSTSKWCNQVEHAHPISLSGVRTKNQKYGNIDAFTLWITSSV